MIRILTESLKFDFVISDVNLMQQKGEKKYNICCIFKRGQTFKYLQFLLGNLDKN